MSDTHDEPVYLNFKSEAKDGFELPPNLSEDHIDEDGVNYAELTDIQIAQVVHEANRALQIVLGETPTGHWMEIDQAMRMSAVDGVENVIDGATPPENHANWMNFRSKQGWTYGPVKDPEAKTHPCMVPYEYLPQQQKLKDYLFSAIVHALYDQKAVK